MSRLSPDYIDRTIATVRQHRDVENSWPQWANIFADEIEALRAELDACRAERDSWQATAEVAQDREALTALIDADRERIEGLEADLAALAEAGDEAADELEAWHRRADRSPDLTVPEPSRRALAGWRLLREANP